VIFQVKEIKKVIGKVVIKKDVFENIQLPWGKKI
tara:strand:+ start:56 stop:157 length:102 start_codon:yes stop_codon:yes gene_type:complete